MAIEDFKKAFANLRHLTDEQRQRSLGDALIYIDIPDALEFLFKTLTPLEEVILKMRYGLGAGRPEHSAEEIALHFARSPSWVYHKHAKAFRKLRHPTRRELVQAFVEEAGIHIDKRGSLIELKPVVETTKQLTPELIAYLKSHNEDLEKIRWEVFEHLVAEFFSSWGFEDVRLVGRNPMTSADVFAGRTLTPVGTKIRYFIEVKRWKASVGVQVIDQVYGAMLNERSTFGWNAAMVISLAGFKDFEKYNTNELALRGVELKNRDDLLCWLEGYKPNKNGLWLPEPITSL